jgi:hypothetical protein
MDKSLACIDCTYERMSTIEGAGNGCFASQGVKKSAAILQINDYVVLQSDFAIEQLACPYDGVIYLIRGNKGLRIFDKSWLTGRPKWHLMNHSSRSPNTRMVLRGKSIYWIAIKDICEGEELLFDYNPGHRTNFDHESSPVVSPPTDTYCLCGGPDYGAPMIQCEQCELWLHQQCVGLSDIEMLRLQDETKHFDCSMHARRVCICRGVVSSAMLRCEECLLELHRECINMDRVRCKDHIAESSLRQLYTRSKLYKDGYIVLRGAVTVLQSTVDGARKAIQGSRSGPIFNPDKKRLQARLDIDEKDLPGFSDINVALGIPYTTDSFVALKSLGGCLAQKAHIDYVIPPQHDPTNYRISYGAIIAIEKETTLDVWPGSHHYIGAATPPLSPIPRKTVSMGPGDVCVFRGDLVHAGSNYYNENMRLHCYRDIPEMVHPKNAFFEWKNVIPPGTLSGCT